MYVDDERLRQLVQLAELHLERWEGQSHEMPLDEELTLDLRDARKELAELRAWREQVFLVVRQLESTLAEHHRIVESLKK